MGFISGILLETATTGIGGLVTDGTTILAALTTWATTITTWIFGNDMARLFLAIMLLMLGLHFVKSFIRTA